ncbi:MAG: phosphate ABC transporter ATP-binding protein [Chloroflexi bacterium]|nr:MAG: phosphate ABC transporter ATP-binding protein [Chloroflexota bacterium]
MSDLLYSLREVTKRYGERQVLAIDSLDVRRGETLAIVGPSGVGKSTLLRLLNLLEPPTSGTIRFQDFSYTGAEDVPLALRRRVTTVFQRPILLKRSVEANVAYGLHLRGLHVNGQIHAALDEVGLAGLARQPARTLSGGEAQRVALARAMILRPDALLLDEPTANLDPYNVGVIERTVAKLSREHGTTLVLVTHNVFQAKRLAQRVALILDGQIVEVGETSQFFDAPRDPRTAAFVAGEMIY